MTSQKTSSPHHAIDIFAAEGAPILAVDDGTLRYAEDPLGGHAFYLASSTNPPQTYYGAHLSAYEGDAPRVVRAGDVIGYVGHTGNAANTSPHLHFESHPQGTRATDNPYPLLSTLSPPDAVPPSPGAILPAPVPLSGKVAPVPRVPLPGDVPIAGLMLVGGGALAAALLANKA